MPRVRGPADGEGIEAKFDTKKTGNLPENSSVLITVSVNNNYFCDKWFKAILVAAKNKFSKITILIVDAPNAYNLEADAVFSKKTPAERYEQALRLGEIWWSKNKTSFQEIFSLMEGVAIDEQIASFNLKQKTEEPSIEVIRWNEWLKEQDFNMEEIKSQFQTNSKLQLAVKSSANSFADRQGLQSSHPCYSACMDGFKKYIIEESIGILLLMQKRKYNFVAYPDPMLVALKETYNILVSPQSGKNADQIWLQIDFKRFRTEEQKTTTLEKKLSILKVKPKNESSSSSDSDSSSCSVSPPSSIQTTLNMKNTNNRYSNSDSPGFITQDDALRKELEEMKKTQEQILLKQKRMEELLLQQAEALQKITEAKIMNRARSSSLPNNLQQRTEKTYFFKKGALRKDFLSELEKQKPNLKAKHEAFKLLLPATPTQQKVQHNSLPSPNLPSL